MSEPPATEGAQPGQRNAPEEAGGVPGAPEPESRSVVDEAPEPRLVASKREDARKNIAYALLVVLAGQLVFFGFAVFGSEETWMRAQEFMQVTLAGTLGLLGSAIGFYFGSQR